MSANYQISSSEQDDIYLQDIFNRTCLNTEEAEIVFELNYDVSNSQSCIFAGINKNNFMNCFKRTFFNLEDKAIPSSVNDIGELNQFLNNPQPSEVRDPVGSRVAIFREKNKAIIADLELSVQTLDQQMMTLHRRIEMKHSNLAGQHRQPFHQKMCEFSRQSLKTELDLEISGLRRELTEGINRKMRSQKQAAYIRQLTLLREKKNKYLRLLQEEEQQLDLEIDKCLV